MQVRLQVAPLAAGRLWVHDRLQVEGAGQVAVRLQVQGRVRKVHNVFDCFNVYTRSPSAWGHSI